MATTDFTIADVLEWARTKPADEEYNYWCNECAVGQFLVETGRAKQPNVARRVYYEGGAIFQIAAEVDEAAYCGEDMPIGTFGGFVKRLEKLCPEMPVTKSDWARLDAYMADIELAMS